MQPQHQTVTDRLADVIHIIHIGGKSGVLTVERGEGGMLEEGFITFVNGRVVEARAGTQSGLAVFNYLSTWQTCRFSLQSRGVDEVSPVYPAQLPPIYNMVVPMRDVSSQHQSDTSVQSVAPVRLRLGEEALQQPGTMQLPRTHRHLLLLIDGQRKKSDLARLIGRSVDEVQELLNDLGRTGFIQL